jgi:hypothetical protein
MTMQIVRNSYNPFVQTRSADPNPNLRPAQIPRSTNESGGLNNMGMINRVRFAKSGCSSCGGSK